MYEGISISICGMRAREPRISDYKIEVHTADICPLTNATTNKPNAPNSSGSKLYPGYDSKNIRGYESKNIRDGWVGEYTFN